MRDAIANRLRNIRGAGRPLSGNEVDESGCGAEVVQHFRGRHAGRAKLPGLLHVIVERLAGTLALTFQLFLLLDRISTAKGC